ncbi:melanocortin-2 receptor accessory protein 2A [Sinocyclocheilus anshuiensis]|uniref:Melanocortin-2 receptor accessory protein 2A n=1 Tax=Sinocyclocheilus anshuiensis TaxID=1608454 RepID=A0A671QC23_9TELE|nr:PREDICTED: melanocortin-2 receptor accessory protein 2A [Sinocyclocheilus anshuiensis]
MPRFQHLNSTSMPNHNYEWSYEYYDDEEPVSFEGLKAHRYSIVIGFWVGLAVFVIFMFFVLTLLTKTGAPHPEVAEPYEKRMRLTSCAEGLGCQREADARTGLSRPLLEESRSLFQCYINEEEREGGRATAGAAHGRTGSGDSRDQVETVGLVVQNMVMETRAEREATLLAHFNIPNFVNSELSSALGDEDLLLGDPPIIMEEARPRCTHHIID